MEGIAKSLGRGMPGLFQEHGGREQSVQGKGVA